MADAAERAGATRRARYARGKALRKASPREKHGLFAGQHARDPVAILAEADATRIQSLLPLKYERMTASPFETTCT